jgi:hypothetical protein
MIFDNPRYPEDTSCSWSIAEKKGVAVYTATPELSVEDTLYSLIILL